MSNEQTGVRFPGIEVQLIGLDGNAMALIAATRRALRRGGATPEQVAEFTAEATSGNYDNVLQTIMRWVVV
jgi:hypothetical protein